MHGTVTTTRLSFFRHIVVWQLASADRCSDDAMAITVRQLAHILQGCTHLTSLTVEIETHGDPEAQLREIEGLHWPTQLRVFELRTSGLDLHRTQLVPTLLNSMTTDGLRELTLFARYIPEDHGYYIMPALPRLCHLEHLTLSGPFLDSEEDLLKGFTRVGENLHTLEMVNHKQNVLLTVDRLRSMVRLPQLRQVDLDPASSFRWEWTSPELFDAIADSMPELDTIRLTSDMEVHPLNYLALPRFQHLQTLEVEPPLMESTGVTLDGIVASIASCRSLTSLTQSFWRVSLTDAQWVSIFTSNSNLTELSLEFSRHYPLTFLNLSPMRNQVRMLNLPPVDCV